MGGGSTFLALENNSLAFVHIWNELKLVNNTDLTVKERTVTTVCTHDMK